MHTTGEYATTGDSCPYYGYIQHQHNWIVTMKAVAYKTPGPIDREDTLQDINLEKQKP